jgi:hypothetical protein
VDLRVTREQTITSGWTQASSLSFGVETSVGVSIEVISANLSLSTNFTTEYGKQFSKSETINVGVGSKVSTVVRPG